MRKIEMEMNSAIRYRRNFSKANTSVRCFKTNGVTTDVDVFLHGNHIASLDTATHKLTIKDGGWQSVTTKSRLNALLDEFAPSMGIFQKRLGLVLIRQTNRFCCSFYLRYDSIITVTTTPDFSGVFYYNKV